MSLRISGILPPLPTVFDARTGEVDGAAIARNVRRLLGTPLAGVLALGSNGEAALLREDEADRVVAAVREAVPSDRLLLAGTGRESTSGTIDACRRAAALGADAVLVRAPSFFRSQMTPPALTAHFGAVADASPVPVILYNFTAATGVSLAPDVVAALASHPNIIGVKESGSDIARVADLVAVAPEGFGVLAGSASTFYAALCAGVHGGVLALAAIVPDACVRLVRLVREGHYEEARALQRQLLPLARAISTGWGVAGLKAALALVGVDVGVPRLPLQPAPESALAAIRAALAPFQEPA